MSRLSDIAVRVEEPVAAGGLGGGVAAVLTELVSMLERAATGTAAATIDLRSLPMSPEDRRALQATLGHGEVHATLNADGLSTLQETGVMGVWWVEHRDREGGLVAELIEVATVPEILKASIEEMAGAAQELRDRLSKHAGTSTRINHAAFV
jgi:hydrogenase-1 operon protein HyaF